MIFNQPMEPTSTLLGRVLRIAMTSPAARFNSSVDSFVLGGGRCIVIFWDISARGFADPIQYGFKMLDEISATVTMWHVMQFNFMLSVALSCKTPEPAAHRGRRILSNKNWNPLIHLPQHKRCCFCDTKRNKGGTWCGLKTLFAWQS